MAESENIVAETAEKIFSDLADAQTINSDKKGAWKAPLWQALTEAGLPLAWVPEDCGGSGASLAEGFAVLSSAGRFAIAVPLAETMLAGWLLAQAKIASPEGTMTVAPASPKDRIALNADGTLSGRARGVPFAKDAEHIAVLAHGAGGLSIALVETSKCQIEAGLNLANDGNDTVTFANVAPIADQAGAEGFRPDRADADGRRGAQPADRRQPGIDARDQRALLQRARRLREEDLEIPGGAAQPGKTRRRDRRRRWPRRPRPRTPSPTPPPSTTKCSSKRSSAKIRCSEAAEKGAAIAHQVHGAIGFTIEHILHRYTLRALAWRDDFGSESYWAVELGKLRRRARRRRIVAAGRLALIRPRNYESRDLT